MENSQPTKLKRVINRNSLFMAHELLTSDNTNSTQLSNGWWHYYKHNMTRK